MTVLLAVVKAHPTISLLVAYGIATAVVYVFFDRYDKPRLPTIDDDDQNPQTI